MTDILREPVLAKSEIVAVVGRGIEWRAPPQRPFQLKVGESWTYVDAKYALSFPGALQLVGRYAVARLQEARISFTTMGGLTMGATPVTIAIAAAQEGCSWFEVCKEPETKYAVDRPQWIVGAQLVDGDRLLVTEDVTSTGASALEAIDIIHEVCADQQIKGVEIVGVCTVLDRGRVAAGRFAGRGISFVALTNYEDVGLEPVN